MKHSPDSYTVGNAIEKFALCMSLLAGICCLFGSYDLWRNGSQFWRYGVAFLCGLAFLAVGFTLKVIRVKVSASARQICWTSKSIIGANEERLIAFSEVNDVRLKTISVSKGAAYKVMIEGDGFSLPVSNINLQDKDSAIALRDRLLESLSLQDKQNDFDATLQELIKSSDEISVIKFMREQKGWSVSQAKAYLQEKT